jgi:D-amino-acid dehydrogenase
LREEDLDFGRANFYTCHRPVSPDDIPIIGQTVQFQNVYLNLGHGSKGWTLAAGSAALLSNIITAEQTQINPAPFSPHRFPSLNSAFIAAVNTWPFNEA